MGVSHLTMLAILLLPMLAPVALSQNNILNELSLGDYFQVEPAEIIPISNFQVSTVDDSAAESVKHNDCYAAVDAPSCSADVPLHNGNAWAAWQACFDEHVLLNCCHACTTALDLAYEHLEDDYYETNELN